MMSLWYSDGGSWKSTRAAASGTETLEVVVVHSEVLPDLPDPGSPLLNGVVEAVKIVNLPHGFNDGLTCHYDLLGKRIEHRSGEGILSPWAHIPQDGESPTPFGSSELPSVEKSAY